MSDVSGAQYALVLAAAIGAVVSWLTYYGVITSTVLLGVLGVAAVAWSAYMFGRKSVDVDVGVGHRQL